jgi:hypothetical protein
VSITNEKLKSCFFFGKAQYLALPFQGNDGKQLFFRNIALLPPKNDFAKETKTKTKQLKPFI